MYLAFSAREYSLLPYLETLMKGIHFQQNGVAADYNAVVSRPYRKVPKVAIPLLLESGAFGARYFRGVGTLGVSLFSGTNNTESKLVPALSRNE